MTATPTVTQELAGQTHVASLDLSDGTHLAIVWNRSEHTDWLWRLGGVHNSASGDALEHYAIGDRWQPNAPQWMRDLVERYAPDVPVQVAGGAA